MFIHSLTGDDFLHLDAATHRLALDCYDQAIAHTLHELQHVVGADPAERDQCLDQLTGQLQLRKLHRQRLAELEEDEQPLPRLASQQYARNEQADVAA